MMTCVQWWLVLVLLVSVTTSTGSIWMVQGAPTVRDAINDAGCNTAVIAGLSKQLVR